ncbi:hypothetical protein MKW98_031866 [Papaver atlanticum]|uniref:Chloroplast thylakoid membrane n=1 Tax=Papaver atlanticum TaxID=357466 RepID=A0AAD4XE82_9MAGN|nr:hypothetical protein MKW98_031866 [Papaver atlanticum]
MTAVGARLISTVTGIPPPKPFQSVTSLPPFKPSPLQQQQQHFILNTKTNRRNFSVLPLLTLIPFLHQPSPASAFSFGISGPKDWLRDQKKKASKYVLAPIDASRNSLRSAHLLLTKDSDNPDKDFEEVQNLLRSATRDCVPLERNSFVSFQASTGVEVCTFTLVLKNAASLLDDNDPVKLETEAILGSLIRSLSSLNGVANEADFQLSSSREKVADALLDTITSLEKFEQGIKDCLDI